MDRNEEVHSQQFRVYFHIYNGLFVGLYERRLPIYDGFSSKLISIDYFNLIIYKNNASKHRQRLHRG